MFFQTNKNQSFPDEREQQASSKVGTEIHELSATDPMEDDLVLASFTATTSQPRELNREADEKLKEARMRRMEADDE